MEELFYYTYKAERKGFPNVVIFMQRLTHEKLGASHDGISRKRISGREKSHCNGGESKLGVSKGQKNGSCGTVSNGVSGR